MSSDRTYGWMWLQALELVDQAEHLQRRFLRYLGPRDDAASWEPPVDFYEGRHGLLLVVALPGVQSEDIEIRLEETQLTVSARRRALCAEHGALVRRLEIPHGRFLRQIELPGPLKIAQSRYINGCLEVRLVRADSSE